MRSPLIELFTSDDVIDHAYQWVCVRRQHYHFNNDVSQLRRWWEVKKPLLVAQIRAGTYRFRAQRVVHSQGEVIRNKLEGSIFCQYLFV
ncbi:hypothetical protein [Microcoleus sp. D3_18_C4]|uniref:hypothetical protein n=1 Tax=Microcoleus sp. D3_18_C4 TaxID=3055335 RepID=UPI002FD3A188